MSHQPLLRYPGGKRWLVPKLLELYKPHKRRRWVEPFVGAGGAVLGVTPKTALLGDLNEHVVNLMEWAALGLNIVGKGRLRPVKTTGHFGAVEWANEKKVYYQNRDLFNASRQCSQDPVVLALFLYLNRHCFNGLVRYNAQGGFNVPFGDLKGDPQPRLPVAWQKEASGWAWHCADWLDTMGLVGPEDFVYVDPPYDDGFTGYTPSGFGWKDQIELASMLNMHKGPMVVSNKATDRVIELYKRFGFDVGFVDGPRSISRDGGGRQAVTEMLATRDV